MQATEHSPQRAPFLIAVPGPREGLWLAIVLAVLSCLPILVAVHPQMADYPSHLARYYVMMDGGQSPWLAKYYDFKWHWSGNLGADLLIWPLAKLFGLETGGRIIAGIIPPLTALGVIAVEWTLRRRIGVGTMLALATVWSPALLLGLLNFTLSVALALFAFAGWVRLEKWRWRSALFLPVGLLVWLCHIAGWGVLGVLVFGYEWQQRRSLAAFVAPWPLALPVAPILLGGVTGPAIGLAALYGKNLANYKLSIWFMALRDQLWWLDIDTLGFFIVAFIAAVVLRRIDWRLGWAAQLFVVLSLALPRHFGGGDYTDYRLIAVALMVGALAIDWRAPRIVLWLAPAVFLGRLALTTATWQANSHDMEAMLNVLDHVPQGARIAGVVVEERDSWPTSTFQHVPSYATIRRNALVNTHFAEPGLHMLQLREGGSGFKDPSQRIIPAPGKPIELAGFEPARQADYLWYIGFEQPVSMPPGAQVIIRTQRSFLARLAKVPYAR